jgi:hypothetical protein
VCEEKIRFYETIGQKIELWILIFAPLLNVVVVDMPKSQSASLNLNEEWVLKDSPCSEHQNDKLGK